MFGLGSIWQLQKQAKQATETAKEAQLEPLKYGNRVEVISGFFVGIQGEVINFQECFGSSTVDVRYQVWLDCEQFHFSGRSNLRLIEKK